jgi:hypothetical protein
MLADAALLPLFRLLPVPQLEGVARSLERLKVDRVAVVALHLAGVTDVGAGVAHFHTIGIPVALTSLAFPFGMLALTFGHETKGQTLPA